MRPRGASLRLNPSPSCKIRRCVAPIANAGSPASAGAPSGCSLRIRSHHSTEHMAAFRPGCWIPVRSTRRPAEARPGRCRVAGRSPRKPSPMLQGETQYLGTPAPTVSCSTPWLQARARAIRAAKRAAEAALSRNRLNEALGLAAAARKHRTDGQQRKC